jgi:hypothetical protein
MAKLKTDRKEGDKNIVRLNVYLSRDAYDALERLQQLTGKRSLAETVRSAVKLYSAIEEGVREGKEVFLYDKDKNERDRLIFS